MLRFEELGENNKNTFTKEHPMEKDKQAKQSSDNEAFEPINPNHHSSGILAKERFKRALSLNPAGSTKEEELRKRLTEEEQD